MRVRGPSPRAVQLLDVFTRYFACGAAVGTGYALAAIALEYLSRPGVLA
jgi:hypothetical protein